MYKKGEAHGPGGLAAASMRNPNEHPDLNETPEGPNAHMLGGKGDGGMEGSTSVSHRGSTYHFK